MDVIYPVRPGDQNEELRYSLRSLANLGSVTGRVWIVGYLPKWVTNVEYLPTEPVGNKLAIVRNNYRVALSDDRLTENVIIMNDDFYVMKQLDKLPVVNRGLISEVMDKIGGGSYQELLRKTEERLDARPATRDPYDRDLYAFDALHSPQLFSREALLDVIDWPMPFTAYGNLYRHWVGKTERNAKNPPRGLWDSMTFLSSNDRSFKGELGRYVKSAFPEPCKYERVG